MSIDRELWKDHHFSVQSPPRWSCPRCRRGTLVLKKESLHYELNADGEAEMREFNSYAEHADVSHFSCLFKCGNAACGEPVVVLGQVFAHCDEDRQELFHFFHPRFLFPSIDIFPIDRRCPDVIADQLQAAFSLFFCNPPAAMSHVRKAVEALCTELGIPRTEVKKGKREWISLHRRINTLLRAKSGLANLADRLLAIKWLGNEGSHSGKIDQDDVLDAFELFEDVIDRQYGHREKTLAGIERQINKRKKPRSKKR
jgi:hypothetical protein